MKIRNGFVTNSSSSSFVISFKNKSEIHKELEKNQLEEELVSYLTERFRLEKGMSKKKVRSLLESEITEEIIMDRWRKASSFDEVDFRAPFTEDEEKELQKRVEEVLSQIGEDEFVIAIEQDDDTEFGSDLEHEILPELNNTRAFFSHH